jgi:hypothetical protein
MLPFMNVQGLPCLFKTRYPEKLTKKSGVQPACVVHHQNLEDLRSSFDRNARRSDQHTADWDATTTTRVFFENITDHRYYSGYGILNTM